jgi:polysaccharide pyruvyl transferase WcaK-like protein
VVISGAAIDEPHADEAASRHALAAMARRSGVPVILTGTTVGTFRRDVGLLGELFEHAVAVGVRDPVSARAAAMLGAADARIQVVGDDAATAGPVPDAPLDLPGLSSPGWLAFSARDELSEADLDAWAAAVDAAAVARGVPVIAVAESRREPWDVAHLSRLAAANGRGAVWHVLDVTDDLQAARIAFGRASGIVVSRALGAWLGLEAGVPVLFVGDGDGPERLRELADLPAAFSDRSVPAAIDDLEARWKTVRDRASDRPTARDEDSTRFLSTHLRQVGVALR